ncbi:glycosyltransferase family 4 protein [Halenospora varia]|nr:glycosyltransferase family 4 protein [Halenospora varia]
MSESCRAPDGSTMWTFGLASNKWLTISLVALIGFTPLAMVLLLPKLVMAVGGMLGYYLRKKTAGRRAQILELVEADEKAARKAGGGTRRDSESDGWEKVDGTAVASANNGDKAAENFDGIIGFFHPFCNAGGGGERVLWAAILATQRRWPSAKIVVYTGDHDADKETILKNVLTRFDIKLHAPTITFLYLTTRDWVLASSWPKLTLLGQSIGSIRLAWDAFSLLTPDIFIDTMGYAFALGLGHILFHDVPTAAYVHYPTISTDMLSSLDPNSPTGSQGVNAGKGVGLHGKLKKFYWESFAYIYSYVGGIIDLVMTNSTWTQEHINSLWGPWRKENYKLPAVAVFPPVAVKKFTDSIPLTLESESKREPILLYLAQFRPEKNHKLILSSFAKFMSTKSPATKGAKLVLIGSVRDDADSKRVYELRLLANELQIKDAVEFHLDATFDEIISWVGKASIGVNGMWNEHFGIGVVEYQAAGLICVVHDSGGPKRDIVTKIDGERTGFHAMSEEEFAEGFEKALALGQKEKLEMRIRARKSAGRFTEDVFERAWLGQMDKLVDMRRELQRLHPIHLEAKKRQ